jgi:hypothetical protein
MACIGARDTGEPYEVAAFRAFIVQEIARWKPMLEEAGFAAQ